ncbi:hypothetical protein AVEN_218192-1 [Araneus ventricosus]|uniref:Uncharacterized protein n=1 Tax=Araneus ventricosus TaxID=182803 RepID=A0A4Y2F5S5_ARAVE|nr:hypothetical protein AVEN_218192-1 [Araneus ventricosus]
MLEVMEKFRGRCLALKAKTPGLTTLVRLLTLNPKIQGHNFHPFCAVEFENSMHCAVVVFLITKKVQQESALNLFECPISMNHSHKPGIQLLSASFSENFPHSSRSSAAESRSSFWSAESTFDTNSANTRLSQLFSQNYLN